MSDRDYALLCQRSYDGTPDYGSTNGPRAFRSEIDGVTTFCFPGSRSVLDWFTDLIATPSTSIDIQHVRNVGLIHLGFLTRGHKVLDLIRADLIAAGKYALCGHSLGGALSLVIAALMMSEDRLPPVRIVTFGAPRVGFNGFVEALTAVRDVPEYHFGADPVPLAPPHPFRHGREPLHSIGSPLRTLNFFENHHIVNYINALPQL